MEKKLLGILLLMTVFFGPIFAQNGSSKIDIVLNDLDRLVTRIVNYEKEGYYIDGDFNVNPRFIKSDTNSFGIQPLLFLKVKSLTDDAVFYTRNFALSRLPNGKLGIDDNYVVLPEIDAPDNWRVIDLGYTVGITGGGNYFPLHFYLPIEQEYEIVDDLYYAFTDTVEMDLYHSKIGYKEIPTYGDMGLIRHEYQRLRNNLSSLVSDEEFREIVDNFLSQIQAESEFNFNRFVSLQ